MAFGRGSSPEVEAPVVEAAEVEAAAEPLFGLAFWFSIWFGGCFGINDFF